MTRPIDHLVLAGHDLDAIAATYRRLGFLVGGRNQHPWGTENRIVQLEGSFLELISLAADFEPLLSENAAAPFANTLARYLDQREGLAMVALQSSDAIGDARQFGLAGIGLGGPLHFSRTAEAADGTRREVAFSTAFALDPGAPRPEFFVCQHHRPENFWNPSMQRHPNSARTVLGAIMVDENPGDRIGFLTDLFGPGSTSTDETGVTVGAGGHGIKIVTLGRFRSVFGASVTETDERPAAIRIGVDSVEAVQRFLNVMGSPYAILGQRLVVPPTAGRGVTLCFEALS